MLYCKNRQGFSLIELIIILAVLAVLGTIGVLTFYQSTNSLSLDNDLQLTTETLNKARQYAVNSKNKTPWGVHFNQDGLILFSGSAFNPSDPANITLNLSTHSIFSTISLSSGSDAVFNQLDGSALSYGHVVVSLSNNSSEFKTINIQPSGIINISNPSPTPSA